MNTTRLNNGTLVLAKPDGYGKAYSNRTQAERAAEALKAQGVAAHVRVSRPFYVVIAEGSVKP